MPALTVRSGQWPAERIAAAILVSAPALWLTWRAATDDVGGRAFVEAIRHTGKWAIYILLATLAVTPARRIFATGRLIIMRRTFGLAAFAYALWHAWLYVAAFGYDAAFIVRDIVNQLYLTVGALALAILTVLALTSSDRAIAALGSVRWNRLHSLIYAAGVLAVLHYLLRSPLNVSQPMLMGGYLAWLLGYRALRVITGEAGPWQLLGLSVAIAALTTLAEISWYALRTDIDPRRIAMGYLTFDGQVMAGWWILGAGLLVTLAGWRWGMRPRTPAGTTLSA